MKLQYKITLFITIMLIIVVGSIGVLTSNQVNKTVETQMGNNAMDLAQTIASMDSIKKNLATTKDYRVIQGIVESFREKTRFQYIIVMDMEGIKYSYPYENSLGKVYRSGGEERVLKYGEAYVSADTNKLISAIRAFVPIYYEGEQVGAVLVGLLNDTVYKEIGTYMFNLKLILVLGLILGIVGAAFLSFNIKNTIYGLEPKEIAILLAQEELVLESFKNGIFAINEKGEITFFNKTAKSVLGFSNDIKKNNILKFPSNYTDQIMKVLETGESVYNQEIEVGINKVLLCSHTVLRNPKDEIIGVASSFQDLTEVKQMAEELIGIKKMTDELRAQKHEFMNKLHTISGLIQLEKYDKVVEYISGISEEKKLITQNLDNNIKNSHIEGILLAKYYKAAESKISLEIDPNSYLKEMPKSLTNGEVCSIIGNLIENAIDELVKIDNGRITVRLNSNKEELRIRIQDNGPGIDEKIKDKIFEKGITTKEGKRGFGLWIIKNIIDRARGEIKLIEDNGTIWDIRIPMEGSNEYD
ncbi:GHKL domain-containing protein [Clostridium bovifaecis]|uniref:histidine kinase n=1 Tax=Clostridium bovifaecis TaxID=2184719 RepID=A0A6I6F2A9_9CLOT|nr:GHKL domain-containing protein [Clostridium bovifaecis]